MTLAEKLRIIAQKELEAKAEKERKKQAEEAALKAEMRLKNKETLDKIKNYIVNSINSGKMPKYHLRYSDESYSINRWISSLYFQGLASFEDDADLWREFLTWLKNEQLTLRAYYENDPDSYRAGASTFQWMVLSVDPLPGPEIEAD